MSSRSISGPGVFVFRASPRGTRRVLAFETPENPPPETLRPFDELLTPENSFATLALSLAAPLDSGRKLPGPESLPCSRPAKSTAAPSSEAHTASHSRVVTAITFSRLIAFKSKPQLSLFLCTDDAFLSNECMETSFGKNRFKISATR